MESKALQDRDLDLDGPTRWWVYEIHTDKGDGTYAGRIATKVESDYTIALAGVCRKEEVDPKTITFLYLEAL